MGYTTQKGNRRKDIAICMYVHPVGSKYIAEYHFAARVSKSPEVLILFISLIHFADTGDCCQQHTSRFKDAIQLFDTALQVANKLEDLCENQTIKLIGCDMKRG